MRIYLMNLVCSNREAQKVAAKKLFRKLWEEQAADMSEGANVPERENIPELIYGPHGKPYLQGNPWYFNISHSGEYLLFVQGKYEVGADLQVMRPCNMDSIAKRVFTEEERQWVFEDIPTGKWKESSRGGSQIDSEEERLRRFYTIWCRKEAYGKYLGCGLTEEVFSKNTLYLLDTITFLEYDILEGYHICICCKKEEESEETVHLLEGL